MSILMLDSIYVNNELMIIDQLHDLSCFFPTRRVAFLKQGKPVMAKLKFGTVVLLKVVHACFRLSPCTTGRRRRPMQNLTFATPRQPEARSQTRMLMLLN